MSIDPEGWALLITAGGTFLTALAAAIVMLLKAVVEIRSHARHINAAVNNQAEGEPTMVERIKHIEAAQGEMRDELVAHTDQDAANFGQLRTLIEGDKESS